MGFWIASWMSHNPFEVEATPSKQQAVDDLVRKLFGEPQRLVEPIDFADRAETVGQILIWEEGELGFPKPTSPFDSAVFDSSTFQFAA